MRYYLESAGPVLILENQAGGTKDEKNYYSYNPEYAEVEEFAHVQSGGQSPIENTLRLPIWRLA